MGGPQIQNSGGMSMELIELSSMFSLNVLCIPNVVVPVCFAALHGDGIGSGQYLLL